MKSVNMAVAKREAAIDCARVTEQEPDGAVLLVLVLVFVSVV